jgi:hypothetical protein
MPQIKSHPIVYEVIFDQFLKKIVDPRNALTFKDIDGNEVDFFEAIYPTALLIFKSRTGNKQHTLQICLDI